MSRQKQARSRQADASLKRSGRVDSQAATGNQSVIDKLRGWAALVLFVGAALAFLLWSKNQDSRSAFEAGSPPQSLEDSLREIVARDPTNDEAQYNLGLSLQSQGRIEDAIAAYQAAIAENSSDARYHNNLAAALAMQKKFDQAIEHFNLALKLEPENIEAAFNLGNALFSSGSIEDAIAQYRKVIALRPEHARAHNNLAVALKESGHLEEAYKHRYEAMRLERTQQDFGE